MVRRPIPRGPRQPASDCRRTRRRSSRNEAGHANAPNTEQAAITTALLQADTPVDDRPIRNRINGGEPFRYLSEEPFEHDLQKRVPATTKPKEVLGFEAPTTLDEMPGEVVPWVVDAIERRLI